MKLYATVSSEKGKSIGKGAQESLYIRVQGEAPTTAVLLDIELLPDGYGHAHVAKVIGSISLLRAIISVANEYIEDTLKARAN